MKRLLLMVLSALWFIQFYAQGNHESLDLLRTLLHHENQTIVYTDRPDSFILNRLENLISRNKFYGFDPKCRKIEFKLNEDEIGLIREKINMLRVPYWKRNLFPKSKMISLDTLNFIMDNYELGWSYFHKFYGKRFYQFIDPIFLRDRSIAIVSSLYMYNSSAGHHETSVFKKENSTWSRWLYLDAGDW